VQGDGKIFLNQESLAQEDLLGRLISLRTEDNDLNVIVRGDAQTHYRRIRAVLDICQQANLGKVELATEVAK